MGQKLIVTEQRNHVTEAQAFTGPEKVETFGDLHYNSFEVVHNLL